MSSFHIIYPTGDRSALSVKELSSSERHELSEYALASRFEFTDPDLADSYGSLLAKANSKIFIRNDVRGRRVELLD